MKNKKLLLIIPITLLIIAIICLFIIKKQNKKLNYEKSITIKVGEKLPSLDDYLNEEYNELKDKKINFKDIYIENKRVYYTGKYLGTFKYKNKKYSVNLVVIDNEKPTLKGVKDIDIFVNDNIDLFANLEISDNSHDELSKKIEGEYDIKKPGTYELEYVISDKAKNTVRESFKLNVKAKLYTDNIASTVADNTKKGYRVENRNGLYYINNILIVNKTYPLSAEYNPGKLLDDFNTNFNIMSNEAKASNINLRIISGFRSYSTQKTLYNNYVKRDGKAAADRYSARAGHSEHQTGLAADINSLEQSFENTNEGKWLNDNCYKYGFIIRYPKGKESATGYMFEPWHIRYVGKELASKLYNNGNWISLEEYLGIDSKY